MSEKSSYKESNLNYGHIFQLLVALHRPKSIVEFGVLEGFSLSHFVKAGNSLQKKPTITVYDIFEKFNGNHAVPDVREKFKKCENVTILEGDFFEVYNSIDDGSVDILHVDIANDGKVYQFAVEKYMSKLTPNGIMILEGGSKERDEIEWMVSYQKPKIQDYLKDNWEKGFEYVVLNPYPSVTIIKRT